MKPHAPLLWMAVMLAALTLTSPSIAFALGDTNIEAAQCSVAAGANATSNSVTCNFGLTPEQLKQVTEAAVKGATGPLIDRITEISRTLGVTEEATKALLKIVGETQASLLISLPRRSPRSPPTIRGLRCRWRG